MIRPMSRTELDWLALAAEAERLVGHEPQGRRVAATVAVAKKLEVGVQTLRRFMFARRFLEALPADARKIAVKMPAIAVATAARWKTHDPQGAAKAILDYYPGKHTLRSFSNAEAAARTASRGAGGARLANAYAKEVKERVRQGDEFETMWPIEAGSNPVKGGLAERVDATGKVDFFSVARSGDPVAMLVVGPYATPRMYSERAADWCLRALGVAAAVLGRAALIVPEDAPVAEFVGFLEGLPCDVAGHIEVLRDTVAPGKHSRGRVQGRRR
jgi:hypothetical protein